jgi:hypothetical protein
MAETCKPKLLLTPVKQVTLDGFLLFTHIYVYTTNYKFFHNTLIVLLCAALLLFTFMGVYNTTNDMNIVFVFHIEVSSFSKCSCQLICNW